MLRNASIVILPQGLLAAAVLLPRSMPAWTLAGLWILSQIVVITALLRPRSSLLGANQWRVPRANGVAITFDDGPHPEDTPAILEILESMGARATFFFIAERALAHPGIVRRVAEAGHELGVHSMSHPWWFSLAGPGRMRREVGGAADVIASLAGRRPARYRPPMGHKNLFLEREVAAAGLRTVTWSARAFDTLGGRPDRIRDRLLAGAAPGAILLLHEGVRRAAGGGSPTVEALPGIIEGLRARGLEPLSLERLRENRAP